MVTEFDVAWVRVRLNKPGAIRGSRDVGILIERRREDYAGGAGAPVTQVLVAAGSNIEPRGEPAPGARRCWRAHIRGCGARAPTAIAAVGFEGEDFVNLVVGFDTDDDVQSRCSARLHAPRRRCGRARNAPKWAPRSMDLDILLYGDRVCDEPGLVLPRPDLVRRAYMLGPAAELAPDARASDARPHARRAVARFRRDGHPMRAWTSAGRRGRGMNCGTQPAVGGRGGRLRGCGRRRRRGSGP